MQCRPGFADLDSSPNDVCEICPSGKEAASGATTCTVCERGKFASTNGTGACAACATGQFAGRGARSCSSAAFNFLCMPPNIAAAGAAFTAACNHTDVQAAMYGATIGHNSTANVSTAADTGGSCSDYFSALVCDDGSDNASGWTSNSNGWQALVSPPIPPTGADCAWGGLVCAAGYAGSPVYACTDGDGSDYGCVSI